MKEIEEILEEIGLPYRYHHFSVEEAVNPPFICYLTPGSSNFAADGIVYHKTSTVDIELYTDEKNVELEANIEKVLKSHEIFWIKSETYIESESMYEVLYEMEV